MADPVLHIKDSYYFEIPKLLYPYEYRSRRQFPDVWISLDPAYQAWEAERLYGALQQRDAGLPSKEITLHDWQHWVHADHANFAKPLKVFLDEKYQGYVTKFKNWKAGQIKSALAKKDGSDAKAKKLDFDDYLNHLAATESTTAATDHEYVPFLRWRHTKGEAFTRASSEAANIQEWKDDDHVAEWEKPKLDAYNGHLSGKILIPQPFATLRNLYERESGVAISKYLLIEIFVGLVLVFLFSRFAARIERGRPAKGIVWNLLEVFLVFIRDQIARPVLGAHDHGHAEEHSHGHGDHGSGEHTQGAHAHAQNQHPADPAVRYLPLLWTIFFFVLGCNLMGMVPWAGTPTAAFAVTLALAAVTFFAVVVSGMLQFGVGGFFLNQIPGMDLPWYMAILIKPMILVIELLGLCIKHGVLAVRLLANMVAGHLVLLAIMGFAFSAEAAATFAAPGATWQWGIVGLISIVASAALSCLELFVAFLQAYIFTFLTALFIGAAIHKH
jgi:F-type H+-transporting ATPase subunit a